MHWECHHGDSIDARSLADISGFLVHLLCGIKSGAYVEICLSVIDGDISCIALHSASARTPGTAYVMLPQGIHESTE